jgi:hypothetical protein
MCLIDDFFLDKERVRKVVKNKIEEELHFDFAARQALEGVITGSAAENAVTQWGDHYKVLRIKKNVRPNLVKALINGAPQIKSALVATTANARHAEIVQKHADIGTLCNTVQGVRKKNGKDRNFTSLASKLLWLLFPDQVPIFDDRAWRAINVVARLVEKAETPDPDKSDFTLNEFCAFLKLHVLCFSSIYGQIDKIISEEFDAIFDGAARQVTAITKEDAERQYANHITVIDQILWHLGGAVPVKECLIVKPTKTAAKKPATSVASVKSLGVQKGG